MTQTLGTIHWSAANICRVISIFLLVITLLEMVMMLSHYWWRIIPLRKEVGKSVVAPPVVWTFCYHIAIALLLFSELVGKFQLVLVDGPTTLNTWLSPVITAFLLVAMRRFIRYYSRNLAKAEHEPRNPGR